MIELYTTPRSPFARRIRLALKRLAINYQDKVIDAFEPPPEFLQRNPLGLIPVMTLSDGTHLPDSNTILEYLESAHPHQIWPSDPAEAILVRQASTWATGIMMCCVSYFLETRRKNPDPAWLEEHRSAILTTLRALDRSAVLRSDRMNQASWDLGVALEYLNMRVPDIAWKAEFYRLESVLLACNKNQLFKDTAPPEA